MNIRTNPRIASLQDKVDKIPECITGTYDCSECAYIKECIDNQVERDMLFQKMDTVERKLQEKYRRHSDGKTV